MDATIVFEDDDLLVLDKPAGLIVNRATSHHQCSLQEQLAAYLGLPAPSSSVPDQEADAATVFAFRQGMVHRLDKDTSGLILWAKNPDSLANLLGQFQARTVSKTYRCLIHGLITEVEGRINLPLARHRRQRQLMAVSPAGRPALTLYRVEERFSGFDAPRLMDALADQASARPARRDLEHLYQGFCLLEVHPKTGRTHQIRAHLTARGHPLVGDIAYLPRRKARLDPLWCPRQFLHAAALECDHPRTGQRLRFASPLPADLQAALTWLLP